MASREGRTWERRELYLYQQAPWKTLDGGSCAGVKLFVYDGDGFCLHFDVAGVHRFVDKKTTNGATVWTIKTISEGHRCLRWHQKH